MEHDIYFGRVDFKRADWQIELSVVIQGIIDATKGILGDVMARAKLDLHAENRLECLEVLCDVTDTSSKEGLHGPESLNLDPCYRLHEIENLE